MATRDYLFYELTNSVCSTCFTKVEAKIIFQDNKVFMLKHCREHGRQKVLISTDIDYYRKSREFLKPGDMPRKFAMPVALGCPYDCGLCSDHEQHSCVTVVELTDRCNLTCPTCYAESSPSHGRHRTLAEIERMLDIVVASEGEPDVVQLSGGEPTLHPDFFAVMDMAKARPIRHLMINTNGVRLARDEDFVARLASYMPRIEVYLQFDSFEAGALQTLRGEDLRQVRAQALAHLNAYNISTTLVVTLQKGLNTDEIGKIIDFGLTQPCVRGVTFQPTQIAGRLSGFDPARDRITLAEVRQSILDQTSVFAGEDLIPVPCHPDAIMMGYALKLGGEVLPLTRYFSPEELLSTTPNTVNFEEIPAVREKLYQLFSTGSTPQSAQENIQSILCCLPDIQTDQLSYDNVFRVIVMQFYDAHNFDVRGVKKSCIHIVHKDGRIIPFDTMNLFYRDPEIERRLREKVA
ncbi:antilisterial bacteriocin subtilosin biosynthesis protein AlbA [Candidatus Phycosocius bacilliformis]|uniref:Antilisterial bacteriocin subtilosin biosynthesis protein AlbA n=1 Tax=Candidatus Phycosocius bacilliformis TaxID=1445552 RepID=A0A2P2EDW7_9PROT|nr:antilisterial bacteriocin subtilosin biosynthesis protein AlbA [Candidatus Phycosocius bacilliformis]